MVWQTKVAWVSWENPFAGADLFAGSNYGGYSIFLYNLGKLAKRGGGGYPQALPKVINISSKNFGTDWKTSTTLLNERRRRRIQKENPKSECLTVTQLSALAPWPVYVWCIMVTGSPSYATRSVTLTVIVLTRRYSPMQGTLFFKEVFDRIAAVGP